MRQILVIGAFFTSLVILLSFTRSANDEWIDLRKIYSRPPAQWPAPSVDAGINWQELGILPESPLKGALDSLKHLVELGKVLFFDPRISGSGKISCASCHQPELSWTDGKSRSLGHEGAINKRNSPTIQNVWVYKKLFWDGRSRDLEDQAFAPINSETEMHGDMPGLSRKLRGIKGYAPLFEAAYGDPGIDPDRIAGALAIFQRTIISRKSRFDIFLEGKKDALSNSALRGLHLFRTRARCINCHHGPLFTDNLFHNKGLVDKDPGLYNVTHNEADRSKFKTPSLRDVMNTGPWMHHGEIHNIMEVIELCGTSAAIRDSIPRPLKLTSREKLDLKAFLDAITSQPLEFEKPTLPQ